MKKQEYTINEINIGDLVTWQDKYAKYENSTWRVIKKLDHTILVIEKIENDITEKRMIDVSDVEALINK